MNKAKTRGSPTRETMFYSREVEKVCTEAVEKQRIQAKFFRAFVRDRVGIKRAITGGGVPADLVPDFQNLWRECVEYLG